VNLLVKAFGWLLGHGDELAALKHEAEALIAPEEPGHPLSYLDVQRQQQQIAAATRPRPK
jgi:hypothetical protein